MFGYGKKNVEKSAELLELGNIRLNCRPGEKEAVIREVGQLLYQCGCVEESYIEAMLQRELTFSTNIGNGIALPHGVEAAKKSVKRSGIAVMVFPEGTDWGGEMVKLVIGIAGAGEDHLEILSIIADCLADPDDVERITECSAEEILTMFTGKRCPQ
ncbi:PTS sugar transporter subunit IIA [Lacrimispora sp.]|uniref:PTS sugar transporter subunit IIA n=1 Tax=Lacrimispora sp. TaxID=2719234 RepID=UPI00289B016A|nr:PTS sugar transporter subunit IIA [Lacrimispora sp.]